MKNMTDEEKKTESATEAGSSVEKPVGPDNLGGGTGESTDDKKTTTEEKDEVKDEGIKPSEETVPKTKHDELEKKLGEQGKELGEYRDFFNDTLPLMEKLQESPELVKAILGDKITPELIKSVLEGKASVEDAKTVTEAHKKVEKELGKKEYDKTSPEEITKLVGEEVKKMRGELKEEFSKDLSIAEQERAFEDRIKNFVADTPDFPEYAERVNKYLDDHPDIADVKVAYDAVKGIALQERYKEDEEKHAAEVQKDLAANAGGGQSKSNAIIEDKDLAEQLIGSKDAHDKF